MAVKRFAVMAGVNAHYITENVVIPNQGSREITDTMLIQFFVLMYFTLTRDSGSTLEQSKAEFFRIYDSINTRRKNWVDGIYGDNTRKAVLLFERAVFAPFKDGIVRPIFDPAKVFQGELNYRNSTKLEIMNFNFKEGTDNKVTTQQRIFATHSEVLRKRFFG